MIYDSSTFELPIDLEADLCVIGSGAGGAAAAATAAEAGLEVVVLEAGDFVPPDQMTQREEEMFPALLQANGSQTTSNMGCTVIQGRALGGSTVHNINLCKRIPRLLREEWRRERGLEHLGEKTWDGLYEKIEKRISVSPIPAGRRNRHNRLLEKGCEELGWESGGLSHNRTGCIGSGFCEVGCAYDAKNNAVKVFVPPAVEAGAEFLTNCRATIIDHRGGEVRGVRAAAIDPKTRRKLGEVVVKAPRVCLSASATGTPAILKRSDVPDPTDTTGSGLRIHPAVVAAGEFDKPVRAWRGIPQSYECTEFLDFESVHGDHDGEKDDDVGRRSWIIPAFAHPVGTATMLPGWGTRHRKLMERYDRLAVFTAMIHDETAGTVNPDGEFGVEIDYWPNRSDRRELTFGLARCAELLFAAGAKKVYVPTHPVRELSPGDSLAPLRDLTLQPGVTEVTGVHPMASVPMGDDPKKAAVDSHGKHHHLDGLWIADGSLFPSSIGVPPQVSIYALGLHVGGAISENSG